MLSYNISSFIGVRLTLRVWHAYNSENYFRAFLKYDDWHKTFQEFILGIYLSTEASKWGLIRRILPEPYRSEFKEFIDILHVEYFYHGN